MAKNVKPATVAVPLYKVLYDGCSTHGGDLEWSLPTPDVPGDWHEVEGDLVRCKNGLHLTDRPSRRWDRNGECYLVETEGPVLHDAGWGDEYVARKVRLVRRLTTKELTDLGVRHDAEDGPAFGKKGKAAKQDKVAEGPSAALQFVKLAWENRCVATAHSWRTINATMSGALELAISGGLSFAKDDFAEIYNSMRGGYWFGENAEHFYRLACEEGNLQACQSIEAWTGRKPFMWEGKRLYRGAKFMWEGKAVTVTSFQDEKSCLIACSYKPSLADGWSDGPIDRRFTITNDVLAKEAKKQKAEAAIYQDATVLRKLLAAAELEVDMLTLVEWTPQERETAAEWAKVAKNDAGKKRVKPAETCPPHLAEAVKHAAERERQGCIRELQEHLRSLRNDRKTADERIAYAEKELAALRGEEAKAA